MSRMISDNIWSKYFGFFIGLYKRNKMVLTIAVVIFFASLFIGLLIGYFLSGFIGNLLKNYFKLLHGLNIKLTTTSIFMHNLQSALFAYFGGIIGIIPAIVLSVNGFVYGGILGYLIHGSIVSNIGVFNPGDFIIYTLPHGIFEISGFIIAGSAGFRLTTLVVGVVTSIIRKTPVSEHYWKFKDSLALLVIAIALIFIAAIIEANITQSVGNYITGLNLH